MTGYGYGNGPRVMALTAGLAAMGMASAPWLDEGFVRPRMHFSSSNAGSPGAKKRRAKRKAYKLAKRKHRGK